MSRTGIYKPVFGCNPLIRPGFTVKHQTGFIPFDFQHPLHGSIRHYSFDHMLCFRNRCDTQKIFRRGDGSIILIQKIRSHHRINIPLCNLDGLSPIPVNHDRVIHPVTRGESHFFGQFRRYRLFLQEVDITTVDPPPFFDFICNAFDFHQLDLRFLFGHERAHSL